eukprot:365004-Chlamydomonas_euryale.AAC.9
MEPPFVTGRWQARHAWFSHIACTGERAAMHMNKQAGDGEWAAMHMNNRAGSSERATNGKSASKQAGA